VDKGVNTFLVNYDNSNQATLVDPSSPASQTLHINRQMILPPPLATKQEQAADAYTKKQHL
jgi:hypothetical protein